MFDNKTRDRFADILARIQDAGLEKRERILDSPQGREVEVSSRNGEILNLCANNYLGLANHPLIVEAAKKALDRWGFGLSSVRFICGTQTIHKELEERISAFLGMDDTILYSSCFDANGGLFETLLGPNDAIVSDALNHASIIDGIRLCKARRFRYANRDLNQLEDRLKEAVAGQAEQILIVTDGVFSMDGYIADLGRICDLAERYGAMVMVDDSHATGFLGEGGKGTPTLCGVRERIDIVTSTLGKALGGASGGFTSARKELVDLLRQRSRPYLFSNSLAPSITAAALTALDLVESEEGEQLRKQLGRNTSSFRSRMETAGFNLVPGNHPITPVMVGDAKKATQMAESLLAEGVYAIAFSYPVVPENQARIRVQVSAAHRQDDLEQAVAAFVKAREEMASNLKNDARYKT